LAKHLKTNHKTESNTLQYAPFLSKNRFLFFCFLIVLLSSGQNAWSQVAKDSSGKIPIVILKNKFMEGIKSDSSSFFKFTGDVAFQHGTDLLFCDTAILNQQKNNLEAFGNVKIVQANGTTILSDYLSYTGNIKKAYLRGNVSLNSGTDNLWTEELDYNLNTKIGNFYQNGTLQSSSTTVSSTLGTYNTQSKEARFTDQVFVTDTAYNIESKDLGYNTGSRMMRFFDSTVVTNESSVLRTSRGLYDSKYQIAHFSLRSSIRNKEQYIEGDTLDYNKVTGLGKAIGNVIILDTAQKSTLYCGKAFYNDRQKTLLAIEKPVLKRVDKEDSLFVRADTFFSAHFASKTDTLSKTKKTTKSKRNKQKSTSRPVDQANTFQTNIISSADTTSPKFYSGFHHVRIFSDSMQGKCDSICFTGKDSLMLMMKNPAMWSRHSQITGDTIIAFIKDGKVDKIVVPNDALIVSRTGPEKANLYNQVQGRTLIAYMVNEELDHATVKPDAECIYYPTDETGAYIGASEAKSERMKIFFAQGEIDKILMEQEIKQTLSPLDKITISQMRLSRFQWLEKLRPTSIAELFD
jgi:lipopolysaccharide export system protein LptA